MNRGLAWSAGPSFNGGSGQRRGSGQPVPTHVRVVLRASRALVGRGLWQAQLDPTVRPPPPGCVGLGGGRATRLERRLTSRVTPRALVGSAPRWDSLASPSPAPSRVLSGSLEGVGLKYVGGPGTGRDPRTGYRGESLGGGHPRTGCPGESRTGYPGEKRTGCPGESLAGGHPGTGSPPRRLSRILSLDPEGVVGSYMGPGGHMNSRVAGDRYGMTKNVTGGG